MIRRGYIDTGYSEMNTAAPECLECDSHYIKHEKESCGDGWGGHGWTEVFHCCRETGGECPEDIKFCQKDKA